MMDAFVALASPGGGPDAERLRGVMAATFDGLLAESARMAEAGADLVLWSEGAVVIQESEEQGHVDRAREIARRHGIHLGLGLVVLEGSGPRDGEPFLKNKLVLISPDGTVAWEYLKANLAPGMEVQWSIRGDGNLLAAKSDVGTITGAICYDLDFPEHVRQAGRMEAGLLLAPSNDWPEIKETHWRMARMRAIENGVPVLRPASSGVSTAIDQFGRILSRVDFYESGGAPLLAAIPVGSINTVYARIGDAWAWICVAGVMVLILYCGARMWGAKVRSQRK
jgi:apolipoprotein N-acyltransferase